MKKWEKNWFNEKRYKFETNKDLVFKSLIR